MRIIAGDLKAKRLISPKTDKTRPTLDRVKEALFSIIGSNIYDSNVLDLFSGTGNLAIESISRGAKFAFINDIDSFSISTIIENIKLTNSEKYVKITKKDYIKCLKQLVSENILFDVIFLDPPYDSKYGVNTLKFIDELYLEEKILAKDGIIIFETDKNFIKKQEKKSRDIKDILDKFDNLICFDERCYGNVILKLYKWR